MLKAIKREEYGGDLWDRFVEESNEAWLWHKGKSIDAFRKMQDSKDFSFVVVEEENAQAIVAMMPLLFVYKRKMLSYNLLSSVGGPALRNGTTSKYRRKIYRFINNELVKLASKHVLYARLFLPPLAPSYRGDSSPSVNPLLELGCENKVTQTWIIDLRKNEKQIWQGLETRARNDIRNAKKNGVTVRTATRSKEDLDSYYSLHSETYKRTGVIPHPREYFQAIWENFLPSGESEIFFAELDGKIIAAANFAIYKLGAYYWTGASSKLGLKANANSLLQWVAIQKFLNQGLDWYDNGEAFPGGSGKEKALSDFKRSFGGELSPFFKGNLVFSPRKYLLFELTRELLQMSSGN